MGTKNKPGNFDCYANAHPDEPMFILLGRDPHAHILVDRWADHREKERGPSAKVDEARACAEAMRNWQAKGAPTEVKIIVNGRTCSVPPAMALTYEKIVGMAAMGGTPSMTWRLQSANASGTMCPGGGSIVAGEGMIFNVSHTGNA